MILYYMEFKALNQLQNWVRVLPREFLNVSVIEPSCSILNLVGDLPCKLHILNNALICGVRRDYVQLEPVAIPMSFIIQLNF